MIFKKLKELIRKELLVLLRDHQTIPLLFLMPVALIFFLSLALKGVYSDKLTVHQISLVLENASRAPKALKLEEKIVNNKLIQRVERPDGYDNDKLFEYGKAHAVVYIPEGFDEGTKPVEIEFDPVLDAGYKVALRSLITGLTAEIVMGIDDIETMASNFIIEKERKNIRFPSALQQRFPAGLFLQCFLLRFLCPLPFYGKKATAPYSVLFTYPVSPYLIILGKLIPYYLINLSSSFLCWQSVFT